MASSRPSKQQQQLFPEDSEVDSSTDTAGTDPTGSKPTANDQPSPDAAAWDDANLAGKSVYVVDAHGLIYQVFHALASAQMTSPRGEPIGAVHGFINDLLQLLEKRKPDYLFCAFDLSEVTFRNELYPEYKAHREAMPEDLRGQIQKIKQMLTALQMPILELGGYEADDILATLAYETSQRNGTCFLVTNDKDCRQLITDSVRIYNIRKSLEYDAAALIEDWGIRPEQVVDFQALVGDSVDNVPGVPLIGPKIAADLIQRFETLEGVYENLNAVAGKKRKENLSQFKDQALISRKLVRLDHQVPLQVDWKLGRTNHFDIDATLELCQEFGFRSLPARLEQLAVSIGQQQSQPQAPVQWDGDYSLVATPDELKQLSKSLDGITSLVFDTETTSTSPRHATLVGISLSWEDTKACYLPILAPPPDPTLPLADVLEVLKPILEDPAIEKVGQNLKYDIVVLRGVGVRVAGPMFDTMVADYLLDPGHRNHSIDDLAQRYFQHETTKIKELIGTGKNQKTMDQVPVDLVMPYASEDADLPQRLRPILRKRLDDQGLARLFDEVEMPLVEILADMEFNGIAIDRSVLQKMSGELTDRIEKHVADIYRLAGREFNIDSRLQLAQVLFEDLELPIVKKTKTGPSTDVEVLTELANLHELPARLIEYRQDTKLKNTYVDALPELIHPKTGRIHTSFMQDVAATGRLSSKDPNLQNIPIRTETGRMIRRAFVPGEPDWVLLAADYSQIELRMLAHFANDQNLQEAFLNDEDIHAKVAAQVANVPLDQVTPEMRRKAKAINFGIIYGQSAFGLAKALNIPQAEAAEFIEKYFASYPGVGEFMEATLDHAVARGQVSTILGRYRLVDGVRSADKRKGSRNLPERIAINTVVQGSAADLIKLAMIRVFESLRGETLRCRLLLQIHDELLFEVHKDDCETLRELVVERMMHAFDLSVPLKVDSKSGPNWGECE